MRQELVLRLDKPDVSQLSKGKLITFQVGDVPIGIKFSDELLAEVGSNGARARAIEPSSVCNSCKRNLADPKWKGKHAKSCYKLRSEAKRKADARRP